jgi:hypothetical protein
VTTSDSFAEWVVLELLGHRRLAGYLTEQQIAGASFLRLDIPGRASEGGATQYYSPGSVYAITPTTEEIARAVAVDNMPAPVQRWELPAPPREEIDLDEEEELDCGIGAIDCPDPVRHHHEEVSS